MSNVVLIARDGSALNSGKGSTNMREDWFERVRVATDLPHSLSTESSLQTSLGLKLQFSIKMFIFTRKPPLNERINVLDTIMA